MLLKVEFSEFLYASIESAVSLMSPEDGPLLHIYSLELLKNVRLPLIYKCLSRDDEFHRLYSFSSHLRNFTVTQIKLGV